MSTNGVYTSIDLFAGIGGLSLGFESAGLHTAIAIEKDKSCAEMFNVNLPETAFFHSDIHELGIATLPAFQQSDLTVVAGGPPCQGFSLMGLRDPEDPRSALIFEFRRFVEEFRPRYFVMENVPGMLSASGGRFVEELIRLLEIDGYTVAEPRILNACEFGAPQDRRRVFLLGTRKDLNYHLQYPLETHISPRRKGAAKSLSIFGQLSPSPTVWDAIHDLPDIDLHDCLIEGHEIPYDKSPKSEYAKLMRTTDGKKSPFGPPPSLWNSRICTNCKRVVHGEVLTKRFNETKPGDTVPISRLYRLVWDDVANTLRAGTPSERGSHSSPRPVHPSEPRCISVREGARLQGFPDWFRFHPTKWHGFRQVGNSVSPFVSRAIGQMIVQAEQQNAHKLKFA